MSSWVELLVLQGTGQTGTSALYDLLPITWEPAMCIFCRVVEEEKTSLTFVQNFNNVQVLWKGGLVEGITLKR